MAIGTRLRGILDELIATGYPDQVAERIVKGDLDMRTDAIIERQQDMFPTAAFHGGGDDIRVVDPNRITRGKTANTGFFMSSSPVNAASYADRAGNIMPLAVDTRGFDVVNAGGNEWNRIVNPDYFLGGDRLATFGELPGYRGTMEPDRGIFDLNVVRDFDTDELARTARRFGSPGLIVKDVQDIGPNYKAFDPAFEAMTGLKLGDEGYQEALDRFSADTIVASDPTRIRSLFAAFDPEYKGSNILGFQGGSQSPSLLNAATQSAVGAASMAAPEAPESALYEGLTDKMVDYLTEQMGGSEEDRERAEYISMGMDFLPFVGAAKGVSETFDAYKNDDTLGMALGAGGILAGMIPFGRGAYKSALGIAEEAPLRDIDKRFSYQPMDGGNQRKFDMARGQSLDFNVENRPLNIQSDNLSLADFEGRPYIFTQSDRSRAGGILTRVGGQDIEPIDLRGGRDFMFDAPSEGMVWASAPDVVGKLDSTAQKLAKEYGQDPLLLPYSMQPTGIDFSTFPVDAMINTARSGMSKTNIKKLDSKIKKILPDWQGVASPDSNYAFRTATGDQRKAIMRLIDSDFKDVPGGMSAAEARVVTSDPAQYTTSGGMVTNVGLLDTSKPIYADSGHPTYIAGLAGEGLGRLETPVTIMPQSRLRGRNISDTPTDAELGAAMRSMSMNPAAQIGLIDEEFLRAYYK